MEFLMNVATGSVDSAENWRDDAEQSGWDFAAAVSSGELVEVRHHLTESAESALYDALVENEDAARETYSGCADLDEIHSVICESIEELANNGDFDVDGGVTLCGFLSVGANDFYFVEA